MQHLVPGPVGAGVGQPDHVPPLGRIRLVERPEQPDRGLGDVVQRGLGDLAAGRALRVLAPLTAQGAPAGPGRVSDRGQRSRRGPWQRVPPAGSQVLQRQGQALPGLGQPVGHRLVDELPAAPGGGDDRAGGQLGGGHPGHPVHQLVRLVDHHHVVLGQHRAVVHGVDGQQRVVGDHDVGSAGLGPGLLGEAVVPDRAAGGAETLPGGHRHLPPGRVRHTGDQLVAVAGLGVLRPLVQSLHRTAHGGDLERVEQLVGRVDVVATVQLVQAQVVAAALEDGERRRLAEQRFQRFGDPGQVSVDELALQRDRRGGDDHGAAGGHRVVDGRHQVGQRLPGAGTGLHRDVLVAADGGADGVGHLVLALPALPADRADRSVQQLGDAGELGGGHRWRLPGGRSAAGPNGRIRFRCGSGSPPTRTCQTRQRREEEP